MVHFHHHREYRIPIFIYIFRGLSEKISPNLPQSTSKACLLRYILFPDFFLCSKPTCGRWAKFLSMGRDLQAGEVGSFLGLVFTGTGTGIEFSYRLLHLSFCIGVASWG